MAQEVYRIEIPVETVDNTGPGMAAAQRKVSRFEQSLGQTQQKLRQMNQTRWQVAVNAVDRTGAVVDRVTGSLRRLTGRAWNITIGIAGAPMRVLSSLFSLPTLIAGAATGAAFRAGVMEPLNMADDLTRANQAFKTFLGNQERATQFMRELQLFGARTPFETDWLTGQSVQLLPVFRQNPEMIMRTLTAFGDAAALTGARTHDIEMSLLGFRQISTTGMLMMEELRQVTENLRVPIDPILEELGVARKDMRDIAKLQIPASKAMEAILRALERPVERGGFLGGMAVQMETMSGQASMLRDNLKLNFIQRWAKGLESGTLPLLKQLNGLFESNSDQTARWGDALEQLGRDSATWVADRIRNLQRSMSDMVNSQDWRNADGVWKKFEVAWDYVVQKPFDQWWADHGKDWLEKKAAAFGTAFGGALGGFTANVLGIASGKTDNSFIDAGATAGSAFLNAFLEAFDTKKIASKAGQAFVDIQGTAIGYLIDAYLLKKGIDLYRWGRNLGKGPGSPVGPGMPGTGGCCCCNGLPQTPGQPQGPKPPTILGPDGKPLPPSTPPARPPTAPPGIPAAAGIGGIWGIGLFHTAATIFNTQRLVDAVSEEVKPENVLKDRSLQNLKQALSDPTPTASERAVMDNLRTTPTAIAAPKKRPTTWWEYVFLSDYMRSHRDAEWAKEQQKLIDEARERVFRAPAAPGAPSEATVWQWEEIAHLKPGLLAGKPVEVKVDYHPQISITSSATAEEVRRILEQQGEDLADRIAGQVADRFETVIGNM